jgi:hypothetical protein
MREWEEKLAWRREAENMMEWQWYTRSKHGHTRMSHLRVRGTVASMRVLDEVETMGWGLRNEGIC